MRKNNLRHNLILFAVPLLFLSGAGVLAVLARRVEGFAQWYSETVYEMLVNSIGRFWGMLPVSAAELLLYLLILAAAVGLIRIIIGMIRGISVKKMAGRYAAVGLWTGSILFFLYMSCCGVNYYRTSFAESTGIQVNSYTDMQLAAVCLELTEEVNRLADQMMRDDAGVMVYDDGMKARAVDAMKAMGTEYDELEGYYPKPKLLLVPQILSVQKVTGIYSPFTIEANCNGDFTPYNVPFTACHELSHLRGFMREEEANFIAWLACRESGYADFQYSGGLRGWISCMNVLYRENPELWAAIRVRLNPLVEADLDANRAYLAKYESPVSQIAETVNDNYLKVNGQSDGIQSYGRMADLIAAYYILEKEHIG